MSLKKELNKSWSQVTPGGGGRTMWCAMSPHDSRQLVAAGDMGGVFRSEDGGANWDFCDSTVIERVPHINGCSPWEYIVDRPGEIWVGSRTRGLLKSLDYGKAWKRVAGPWDELDSYDWFHCAGPHIIRFCSDDSLFGIAAWNKFGNDSSRRIFMTDDAGLNWLPLETGPVFSDIMELVYRGPDSIFVICRDAVFKIAEGKYELIELPEDRMVKAACGCRDTVYLIMDAVCEELAVANMSMQSGANTELWKLCLRSENMCQVKLPVEGVMLSTVASCRNRPDTAYLGIKGEPELSGDRISTLLKSVDGGRSWQPVLFRHPDQPGFNISRDRWTTGEWGWQTPPWSVFVDYTDPDKVTFTDFTMCGVSHDGGGQWDIVSSAPMHNNESPAGGMQMLTGWNYYIKGNYHFGATTDFTAWKSRDAGLNWVFCPPDKTPWHNNIYAMAFLPAGRIFGAASLKHDLPYWHHMLSQGTQPHLWRGGVVISDDDGVTWTHLEPSLYNLPDLPATDILYDEKHNRLYVAYVGGGVYLSDDLGASWTACNDGLPVENMNSLRLKMSPQGELYLVITARWNQAKEAVIPGFICKFDLDQQKWRLVNTSSEIVFPVNLEFSGDGQKLYVSCFQLWREKRKTGGGAYAEPGAWLMESGNCRKIYSDYPVYSVNPVPGCDDSLLLCTIGQGALLSRDSGHTWKRLRGLPPANIHSATFDPEYPGIVYLTTFGHGIWRGRVY